MWIRALKFDYFRDTILKSLGIDYEFVDIGPTELVELTIHSLYMDFTFLTKEGFYIHIEFQTTDKGEKDLRRFLAYDAVYSLKTGKNQRSSYTIQKETWPDSRKNNCNVILYTLADKFLDSKELDEIKEVISMTRLGQMLLDEGMEKGMKKGMEQGLLLSKKLLEELNIK